MPSSALSRIDLNLIVAMQVLLEERSVTRAAERLFITQPAMSKTLQRLRILFDDELFVR
ncbi:MAG: LysR family transcriptional regulator, partial [Porticoccaceae bacterium]|nr:LysR family transcriptional regulator [Porticoccaceae bacterium]